MRSLNAADVPAIACAGGYGVNAKGETLESLAALQMMLRFRKMGLTLHGCSFFLCTFSCKRRTARRIRKEAGAGKNLLILSRQEIPGKGRKSGAVLLTLACSGDLFFLSDGNIKDFSILPFSQGSDLFAASWETWKWKHPG